MDAFEHLAVLVSIVIGLGISHLLTGVGQVLQARIAQGARQVRIYWIQGLWVFNLFVLQVQLWWAFFGRREVLVQGTIFGFFYELLILVPAYLASVLVLPDVEEEERVDLEGYYFESRRWLFPVVAVIPLLVTIRAIHAGMAVLAPANVMRLAFIGLLVSLAATRNRIYHALVTVVALALFVVFIVRFSLHLP